MSNYFQSLHGCQRQREPERATAGKLGKTTQRCSRQVETVAGTPPNKNRRAAASSYSRVQQTVVAKAPILTHNRPTSAVNVDLTMWKPCSPLCEIASLYASADCLVCCCCSRPHACPDAHCWVPSQASNSNAFADLRCAYYVQADLAAASRQQAFRRASYPAIGNATAA